MVSARGSYGAGPSNDAVPEGGAGLEAAQVLEKVVDEAVPFVGVPACRVGRDHARGERPEWVVRRQRLGIRDVEVSGAQSAALERGGERALIDGGAAAHVVEG